jgi:hypothetical protein
MNLSDRDKRILKIAGPVLGGILVLFLVFNLFFAGGGGEPAAVGPVVPPISPTPSPSVTESPTQTASPVIVFAGRDPFSIPPILATSTATSTST